VVLIVEARHRIIRLRCEICARDAARREGFEHREAAAARKAVDQGGDEYGLARPRQAGDAEPDRRVEEVLAKVKERPRRQARLFDDVG